ncbi:hypothetical protein BDZ94DRAFT_284905 [Collybia nuda]|uniref:Uncharacterized protein n=1 Tax=Collybia nuda TaxID=64659 RepID=A0A9P6CH45_9AGAR|nr:hypothetical protein BDZ94DRAFT_284905 [Collybia nuda]
MSTFEHAYYIGNGLSLILYGLDIALYYSTMRNLFLTRNSSSRRYSATILSTASLFMLTIDVSTNAIYGEQAWITFRDSTPGGPPVWIIENFSVWYQVLSTTSVAGLIFMSDGFLIYRFYVIWGSRWVPIMFPGVMYLAGLALAILEIYTTALPGSLFFSGRAINFGLPYYTISIALNVILTVGIVVRVSRLARRMRPSLDQEGLQIYTGVTSMLIESAALYSLFGIVVVIPYGLNVPTAVAFAQVWTKLAAIAPQLILMRISSGKGWSKEVVDRVESDLVFKSPSDPITSTTEYSVAGNTEQTLTSKSSKKWGDSREVV